MSTFFDRQREKPTVQAVYVPYYLGQNPFPNVALLNIATPEELRQANSVFVRQVREKEIERLLRLIDEAAQNQGAANFWVEGERGVGKTSLIVEAWNHFQRSNVYLPVFVRVPRGGVDALGSIFDATTQAMSHEILRLAVFAFVYKRLKEDTSLPTGWDASALLQAIEDTNFVVLDEILQGKEPLSIEKRPFISFVLEGARRAAFSATVEKAIEVALKSDFTQGHLKLRPGSRKQYADSLASLLRLLTCYYEKVVVFIDQLDTAWTQMKPRERSNFVSAVSEFVRLSSGTCILVMASYPEIPQELSTAYRETARVIPITDSNRVYVAPFTDTAEVVAVIERYLWSDNYRQSQKAQMERNGISLIHPFTEGAISVLREAFAGNISQILVYARDLIEKGRDNSFPLIDQQFTQSVLQVTTQPEPAEVTDEEMKEVISPE
ncbi:ATP-binding protein [Candidatus Poribacteria bacterium]|nr:ATP-binding protein [Candidatus Poribacteria bacterium]